MASTERPASLRFAEFELRPQERLLLRDGQPLALGRRAFEVLLVLAAKPGELVSKDDLLTQAWPGLVVEEGNIAAQVLALRKALGPQAIATVPGFGYRFTLRLDDGAAPAAEAPSNPPAPEAPRGAAAVPPGLRLFGRAQELARLQSALQTPGLLTVIGPSGVGKTRLARALLDGFGSGAGHWLDLAALNDATQLLPALARLLNRPSPGAAGVSALAPHLGREDLLVLDNAEHMVGPVAELVAALRAAWPQGRLLVTSQVPLHLADERIEPLEPLAVQEQGWDDGAIGLMVARIAAADSRIALGPEQVPLLGRLCAQLDGLPLGIEMAAARVPLLGLQGVFDALGERFAMLRRGLRDAPSRHQTLHAALDWSYALLEPEEQRLFRALGVCNGGFSLELMQAVAAVPEGDAEARWQAIDTLGALVERSLVVAEIAHPPRYRLLETMRAYALEQLAQAQEEAPARSLHGHAMVKHMLAAAAATYGGAPGGQAQGQAAAVREFDNYREAMTWALQHDPECAVRMSVAALNSLVYTAMLGETAHWLAACEPVLGGLPLPTQAKWWGEQARALITLRRGPQAIAAAIQAGRLSRELGDDAGRFHAAISVVRACTRYQPEVAPALAEMEDVVQHAPAAVRARLGVNAAGTRAVACELQGDLEGALRHREDERRLALARDMVESACAAESNIVALLAQLGRAEEALPRARAALGQATRAGSLNATYLHAYLVELLLRLGRLDEALQEAPQALHLARRDQVFDVCVTLCQVLAGRSRHAAAAQWLGHALQQFDAAGQSLPAHELAELQGLLDGMNATLGAREVERLVEQGRGLSVEQADALLVQAAATAAGPAHG